MLETLVEQANDSLIKGGYTQRLGYRKEAGKHCLLGITPALKRTNFVLLRGNRPTVLKFLQMLT